MNMNMRSVVLIGIALVIAGVTAFLARSLVSTPQPQTNGSPQAVAKIAEARLKILVAAADMEVGHFVKAEDMIWQSWPDDKVHDAYIQQESDVAPDSFVGAVVKTTIAAGEPIIANRMVKPGDRGFMAAVLPAGKRAISIRINATSGNAGFIFPGDRVDILLTHEVGAGNRGTARVSETVLSNVRVLAINQRTDNPTHTPSIGQTATLEVTPKEAEKISLINRMGELTLVLRSLGKEESAERAPAAADRRTITWDSEVSTQISGAASTAGPAGRNMSVEVFRGGSNKAQIFDFNKLFEKAMTAAENNQEGEEGLEE